MKSGLFSFFAPPPPATPLPESQVRARYPWFRWRVLEATFLGYAAFYLTRNNLGPVSKDIQNALHYDKEQMGNIVAITAISYGVGKFFMGTLSDRSNARVFMSLGLFLTAIFNFAFGFSGHHSVNLGFHTFNSYEVMFYLWGLNGFVQGMGWPPCGRCMGHWFSEKERGLTFSMWNTSHNLGGGIAGVLAGYSARHFGGWQFAFFVPGVICLIGSVYLFFRLVDTPQSVGLPAVEVYKEEPVIKADAERQLSFKELLIDNVLLNKFVWILAVANFFAYVSRYVMLDWGPTYLREVKGATIISGSWSTFMLEFGGIPSTILLGWISDKFGGRRGAICTLCMIPIMLAFCTIMLTPKGYLWLDMSMLIIVGLFIYPVINLIVIMALDVTSKKAIGAAAGFIGFLGYFGRTAQAKGFGRMLDYYQKTKGIEVAWMYVFYATLACSFVAMLLLAFTWNHGTRKLAPTVEAGKTKQPAGVA